MSEPVDFNALAKLKGFLDERDMFTSLYPKMSLRSLASFLGTSVGPIRMRAAKFVEIRDRGGNNNEGNRKMRLVPDNVLYNISVSELSERYEVSESTVVKERKRRKECQKQNELL